jgi:FNIP repeat protein
MKASPTLKLFVLRTGAKSTRTGRETKSIVRKRFQKKSQHSSLTLGADFELQLRQHGLPKSLKSLFLSEDTDPDLHIFTSTFGKLGLGLQLAQCTLNLEEVCLSWITDASDFFGQHYPQVWHGTSPSSPARKK